MFSCLSMSIYSCSCSLFIESCQLYARCMCVIVFFSIYSVLVHLYYLNAARCTRCTYMAVCYVCFVRIFGYLLYFFHFCLSLLTGCHHQVYEMYVAGFKFHLLNNAFTSHWGFQVQQDKVLFKTAKVKRLLVRKMIRKIIRKKNNC